jgi:hypothetical protein
VIWKEIPTAFSGQWFWAKHDVVQSFASPVLKKGAEAHEFLESQHDHSTLSNYKMFYS